MALDIHLGLNRAKAEQVYPSLSFGEDIHDIIFSSKNRWIDNYSLFAKMSDYYGDAYYPNEKIGDLKCELKEIISKIKDKKSNMFLKEFIILCDLAIDKNENIYCFCD